METFDFEKLTEDIINSNLSPESRQTILRILRLYANYEATNNSDFLAKVSKAEADANMSYMSFGKK